MEDDAIISPPAADLPAADAVTTEIGDLATPADSLLHQASWRGDLVAVRACLEDDADVVCGKLAHLLTCLSPACAEPGLRAVCCPRKTTKISGVCAERGRGFGEPAPPPGCRWRAPEHRQMFAGGRGITGAATDRHKYYRIKREPRDGSKNDTTQSDTRGEK